jgi:hypothetical protein
VAFFQAYPELATRPFFMSGESYAGVLVPTLALKLLAARNQTNAHRAPWSLTGFALGNDCPGNHVFTCTPYSGWHGTQVSLDFLAGHGMLPEAKKREIDVACADWYVTAPPGPEDEPPAQCKALLEDAVRPAKSIAGDTYDSASAPPSPSLSASRPLSTSPSLQRPPALLALADASRHAPPARFAVAVCCRVHVVA